MKKRAILLTGILGFALYSFYEKLQTTIQTPVFSPNTSIWKIPIGQIPYMNYFTYDAIIILTLALCVLIAFTLIFTGVNIKVNPKTDVHIDMGNIKEELRKEIKDEIKKEIKEGEKDA